MFENLADVSVTHHELREMRLEAGEVEPVIVGSVNLDELTTTTGIPLGRVGDPGHPWRRLRWNELAARLSIGFDDSELAPCFGWFPYRSWPATIQPPPAGSLDDVSLRALVEVLADHSRSGDQEPVFMYYAAVLSFVWPERALVHTTLERLATMVDAPDNTFTPSNLWPNDSSWLVYTDYDLMATKISGPAELTEDLIAHPDLETFTTSE